MGNEKKSGNLVAKKTWGKIVGGPSWDGEKNKITVEQYRAARANGLGDGVPGEGFCS